jgi:hypothetical protein
MKTRRRIVVLAICMAFFLLPSLDGQAEEVTEVCPKPYIKAIFPWSGRPGDVVIIRGLRFGTPPGEVIFAEAASSPPDLLIAPTVKAEILSWTYHRISVFVPKSAVSGSVFVRVHCGAKSNKVTFTVN